MSSSQVHAVMSWPWEKLDFSHEVISFLLFNSIDLQSADADLISNHSKSLTIIPVH